MVLRAVKKSDFRRNFLSASILSTVFGGTEVTVLAGVQEGRLAGVAEALVARLGEELATSLGAGAGKLGKDWAETWWERLEVEVDPEIVVGLLEVGEGFGISGCGWAVAWALTSGSGISCLLTWDLKLEKDHISHNHVSNQQTFHFHPLNNATGI